MAGLRAQVGAKFGPLPIWAWALLFVLAIIGWMYVAKVGFFAPGGSGIPQDTSGGDPYGDNPLGLGGLAGGGNPGTPNADTNPVPAYYDPNAGGYVGQGAGSGNTSSSPTVDLSSGFVTSGQQFANAALGSAGLGPSSGPAPQHSSGPGYFLGGLQMGAPTPAPVSGPSIGGSTILP